MEGAPRASGYRERRQSRCFVSQSEKRSPLAFTAAPKVGARKPGQQKGAAEKAAEALGGKRGWGGLHTIDAERESQGCRARQQARPTRLSSLSSEPVGVRTAHAGSSANTTTLCRGQAREESRAPAHGEQGRAWGWGHEAPERVLSRPVRSGSSQGPRETEAAREEATAQQLTQSALSARPSLSRG